MRIINKRLASPSKPEYLNRLWNSKQAQIVPNPVTMPSFNHPYEWALKLALKDKELFSTLMRKELGASQKKADGMMYASRGGASKDTRKALVAGARRKAAVQLQVNDLSLKSRSFGKFFEETFKDNAENIHPFGYKLDMAMFVTGPSHIYNAHCDLADGFLFQLHGVKRIKVWGPNPKFFDQVVFNHDFRGNPKMFDGKEIMYEIRAGQGLYFPRGMMHEISIPENETSVSVSVRTEHVYPVLELVSELCNIVGGPKAFWLPSQVAHWDKFRCMMFNPSAFAKSMEGSATLQTMPKLLKNELLKSVRASDRIWKRALPALLDHWWKDLTIYGGQSAIGTLPNGPANRGEILQQLEKERLSRQ